MKKMIIPLQDAAGDNRKKAGNKAAVLAKLLERKIRVPGGFCITRDAYDAFLKETGTGQRIIFELGRKPFEEMRWEEMWDASLRIRNMFTTTAMPDWMRQAILKEAIAGFSGKPVAVRSSSLAEDSAGASFAGMHESFVNVSDPEKIIQCVKLVWASLWSDAALLYRKELSLDIETSAMAVIIQEMITGDVSGVGFCVDPNDEGQGVIESVYGLNQGLVDGDVEPDRYFLDRRSGKVVSSAAAVHDRRACPVKDGVRIIEAEGKEEMSLDNGEAESIFKVMLRLEELFGSAQDVEWTLREERIYILQSRPVTVRDDGEKSWYLSLRRSLDNLQRLAGRIEDEILPLMDREAKELSDVDLAGLSTEALAAEVDRRKKTFDRWHDIYWEECIPFAHGVRLFGTVYNDTIHPRDPYEFIDLIVPEKMVSLERNERMKVAGKYLLEHPDSIDKEGNIKDSVLGDMIDRIMIDLGAIAADTDIAGQNRHLAVRMLKSISEMEGGSAANGAAEYIERSTSFIEAFPEADRDYARQLLSIARKSYQFRDDDNIYLGRIEAALSDAMLESRQRLGSRCDGEDTCTNPEEVITALRFPGYLPKRKAAKEIAEERKIFNARQLRGQPAGKGLARGIARVIEGAADLFDVRKDEILVCDAIDPTMTFAIPLVNAIVERRGGMLIHGAIIAREYGIPCVTGIPRATELIRTGDDITVDGYRGMVINHTRTEEGAA